MLEDFLSEYPGCLLIVSHDRYFMDRLVDHLFIFEGNGAVQDFPGNYSQYRLQQKAQIAEGREQKAEVTEPAATLGVKPVIPKKVAQVVATAAATKALFIFVPFLPLRLARLGDHFEPHPSVKPFLSQAALLAT